MNNSSQIFSLRNVNNHIDRLCEMLENEKHTRSYFRECDPEEDDVPDFIGWAIKSLELAQDDINNAIHSLEWEDMSQAEKEEFFRHGVKKSSRVAL